MKYVIIIVLSLFSEIPSPAKDSTVIMFWNLENFFDYRDSGNGPADTEFSSTGQRHWTKKRFYAKCNAIAKAVMWIGSEKGRMPDIIGVAEVEDRFVLNRLVYATALKKYDYGIVHYDSPDPRGIDVGLLYRRSVFKVISSRRCPVTDSSSSCTPLLTRDILEVKLKKTESAGGRGDSERELTLLVNHHPSKYGGDSGIWRRKIAIARLKDTGDSLVSAGAKRIIAMGDFNDTPDNPVFSELEGLFINKALPLYYEGYGTIRYKGKWDLIDMFFVSKNSFRHSSMEIAKIPFLMVRDNTFSGEKPLRTYSGPKYVGGVSDHCPILLVLW